MHFLTLFFLAAATTAIPASLTKRNRCGSYRDVNAPVQIWTPIEGGGHCHKLARPGEAPFEKTIYEFSIDGDCEWCMLYPEETPEDCAGGECKENCLDTGKKGEQISVLKLMGIKGANFTVDRGDKAYFKC